MHKTIVAISCLIFSTNTFADICPSIQQLKNGKASYWKAHDSDDGKPLSAAREAKLKKAITKFAMAEWSNDKKKNIIHCYYNNAHGSAMEAYFAKESALPVKSSKYWYQVTGMMQCAAGADKCQFQVLPEMKHQLASNQATENSF